MSFLSHFSIRVAKTPPLPPPPPPTRPPPRSQPTNCGTKWYVECLWFYQNLCSLRKQVKLAFHPTFSINEIRNDSMKMDYCVKCVILLVGIVGAVKSLGELCEQKNSLKFWTNYIIQAQFANLLKHSSILWKYKHGY